MSLTKFKNDAQYVSKTFMKPPNVPMSTANDEQYRRFSADPGIWTVVKFSCMHNSESFANILCSLLNENFVHAYNII